ncbi:TlpA family protein disulfide reductase [Parasediminibacterium paludis]|uniref:TlpA family protein disulfide reductase n=1 Tax=Parasediminibacterium paludis TaxID=908966 RepID=A0ABV8PYW0_9BACT
MSFDKDSALWLQKIKTIDLPKGNSYILVKNFESMFALYFKINSIPRYLLIDRNGKVFNINAPRPSKPELKKNLDKLLAN